MIATRWFYPIHKPISCLLYDLKHNILPELTTTICFDLENPNILAKYKNREDYENSAHRYYCTSCYSACGNKEAVFRTGVARLKEMKSGPTDKQQAQMSEHADQHSIIWNWARQQDKR